MIISASELNTYNQCPRKYRLFFIDGHEYTNERFKVGREAHNSCQAWVQGKDSRNNLPAGLKFEVRGMVRQFQISWNQKGYNIAKPYKNNIEKEIEIKTKGGLTIITHIDIFHTKGVVEIKTSKFEIIKEELEKNIQFPTYAKAYEIHTGNPGVIECFALGYSRWIYPYKLKKNYWKETIETYYEIYDRIRGKLFDPIKSDNCFWCQYKKMGLCGEVK